MRGYKKTVAPGHYNLRFRPSQGIDNVYVHYWANIHSADGFEKVLISYPILIIILEQNREKPKQVQMEQ